MPRGDAIGLGWRPSLAPALLGAPERVDFVEVVAESCFTQGALTREARALSSMWPVVVHGIKTSLGSADGVDPRHAARLGALARDVGAVAVTEHVALVRGGDVEVGHLTALPRTRESVSVVAHNVELLRRHLSVPLLLENVAATFEWPDAEMDEPDFYTEVCRATGCPLLLDVSNLYANAINAGVAPLDVLERFPLERVAMLHVAGGHFEGGFFYDTHADPVPDAVFAMVASVARRAGPVPVILERDAAFPATEDLLAELARAKAAMAGVATRPHALPQAAMDVGALSPGLAARQRELAVVLTDVGFTPASTPAGFHADQLLRTREILQNKRVDEALPLLVRLNTRADEVMPLARRALAAAPRATRGAAVSDAWTIVRAAGEHDSLRADARADELLLRARFHPPRHATAARPRWAPWVGRTRLHAGHAAWAFKGPGAGAPVRLWEG